MTTAGRRFRTPLIIVCLVLLGGFTITVQAPVGSRWAAHAIDDVGQALAAAIACVSAGLRSRSSQGRSRLSWALLSVATGCWSAGQTVWSYYELISSRATPFPSYADLGYLLFPVFALAGLLVRPSAAFAGRGRMRLLLDGVMLAASLFIISWLTVLGEVYRTAAQAGLGKIVGLAYPASDVVLVTVVVLVVVQAQARGGLLLLVGGLMTLALADSGFVYLTAQGSYSTGSLIDSAWVGAFLLLALAAAADSDAGAAAANVPISAGYVALPYFLVLASIAAAAPAIVRGSTLILGVSAIALISLMTRQLLTLLDNRVLSSSVAEQREELRYRAYHDALTGLANRALFSERLRHALELHQRDPRRLSLLFCDLDDFKLINDTLGHDAGDEILVAVANRLTDGMRAGDTVARWGGDEFAILLEDSGDPHEVSARLLETLAMPISFGNRQIPVRASIGITTIPPNAGGIDVHQLLKRADVAMYEAKRCGKAIGVEWTPQIQNANPDDLDMRMELADAVAAREIEVAYQPILFMDGSLYGNEALARWIRSGVLVPPSTFIPVAQRAGFLPELDMHVITCAIASTAALSRESHASQDRAPGDGFRPDESSSISVNIALTHLADRSVASRIEHLLDRFEIAPWRLIVEVPEDHAIESAEVLRSLKSLREMGVRLALDDFGVGYSSLSRVGALSPDIIKLDRSFIAALGTSDRQAGFVMGIIELAHRLGTMIVAEGVETPLQLELLREMKCDLVQGYLTGHPVLRPAPAADLTASRLAKSG